MTVKNIPTRYALIERAKKIMADIDKYFDDAHSFGLDMKEADPDGDLIKIKTGIVKMLEREKHLIRR